MQFKIYQLGPVNKTTKLVHKGLFFGDVFKEKDEQNQMIAHKSAFMQIDKYIMYLFIKRVP